VAVIDQGNLHIGGKAPAFGGNALRAAATDEVFIQGFGAIRCRTA